MNTHIPFIQVDLLLPFHYISFLSLSGGIQIHTYIVSIYPCMHSYIFSLNYLRVTTCSQQDILPYILQHTLPKKKGILLHKHNIITRLSKLNIDKLPLSIDNILHIQISQIVSIIFVAFYFGATLCGLKCRVLTTGSPGNSLQLFYF